MKRILVLLMLFCIVRGVGMGKDISYEKATFAGGCFWCMEPPFVNLDGVINVIPGYTGGDAENPSYEKVSAGITGHREAVQITYNPSKITYEKLLKVFWIQIDPTDEGGQFADRGTQYNTGIFYHNEEQKVKAQQSKQELSRSGKFKNPIVTEIIKAEVFYPAEEYHNDYYKKNPDHYKQYKYLSGRQLFIEQTWPDVDLYNKPPLTALKKKLSPLQYKVTQEDGTEPSFNNTYWDNKEEGLYVDIVSGEPLFSSTDKFKSGTGWPSFVKPLEDDNIIEKTDRSGFMKRTEVRSKVGDSHLGHVFPDGPKPTGLRYCINSAALRFIPKDDLEKEGFSRYKKLFNKK